LEETLDLSFDRLLMMMMMIITNVVLTEEYNVMVNSQKLIGTTECLTL